MFERYRGWRRTMLRTAMQAGGFTLIELLVVLLIMGILLKIALPSYLSVSRGAGDTAVQSNLQSVLVGARSYFSHPYTENYAGVNAAPGVDTAASSLAEQNLGLSALTATTASQQYNQISVGVPSAATPQGSVLVLEGWAQSTGTCWGIVDIESSQTGGGFAGPGNSTAVGTYFFGVRPTSGGASNCAAASFGTLETTYLKGSTGWRLGGFPAQPAN